MQLDAYRDDRPSVIARLRDAAPLHLVDPLGAWLVVRHDVVQQLLTDDRVTSDPRAYARFHPAPEGSPLRWLQDHNPFSAAPGVHARLRELLSPAFTPRATARRAPIVREVVAEFARGLTGRRGVVDLYREFFEPIPAAVIGRIVGAPASRPDERRFRELARQSLAVLAPLLAADQRDAPARAVSELREWLRQLVRERRARPRDDLLSRLARAATSRGPLDVDEVAALVIALLAAGSDPTVTAGAFALRTLLAHPAALAELRADRALLPSAVNELLRYDFGPADWLPRYALADFELEKRAIRRGQLLMLSATGAHRDPAVFPDPDRLDLRRDNRMLLLFGRGAHYCIGASLARLELAAMLDAALDFLPPGARVVEEAIDWRDVAPLFRRIESLPVDFGAA